ncbi:MAG: Rnf-Nqr domain containing protein [Acutalibacteraceae bacterium]
MSNSELSFKDIFVKGAVIYNPVLIQLVGLCPVVAASTTLKSAVMLSAAMCVSLVVTCVLASAVLKKVPRWVRMPVYLLTGLLMICPLLWFVETKTLATLSLGIKIYLPLVAINSVTAVHCEQFAVKNSVKTAFYDAAAVSLGASGIFILTGAVREILGSSSIAGIALNLPITLKGMALPFGCLVLLGFMAAALKSLTGGNYAQAPAPEISAPRTRETQPVSETEITEVEIFDEFWLEQEAETQPEPAPEPKQIIPEEPKEEDSAPKYTTAAEIDELLRSLGIDTEGGDKQ